jgi:NADH-quinone oxidoreductase subunit E
VKPEAERLISLYPQRRSAVLPLLHAFQDVEGFVSAEAMAATAEMVGEPVAVIESTASFYTLFFRRPVGRFMLQPCRNLSCMLRGAYEVMAHFRERLGVGHLETTEDGLFSYEEVECLAACDRAPCMQVNSEFVYDLTNEKVDELLSSIRAGTYSGAPLPQTVAPAATWRVGLGGEKKSVGAQLVPNPNDPGGFGDATGVYAIERLIADPTPVRVRPTRERLVVDGAALLESEQRAGHEG